MEMGPATLEKKERSIGRQIEEEKAWLECQAM